MDKIPLNYYGFYKDSNYREIYLNFYFAPAIPSLSNFLFYSDFYVFSF